MNYSSWLPDKAGCKLPVGGASSDGKDWRHGCRAVLVLRISSDTSGRPSRGTSGYRTQARADIVPCTPGGGLDDQGVGPRDDGTQRFQDDRQRGVLLNVDWSAVCSPSC